MTTDIDDLLRSAFQTQTKGRRVPPVPTIAQMYAVADQADQADRAERDSPARRRPIVWVAVAAAAAAVVAFGSLALTQSGNRGGQVAIGTPAGSGGAYAVLADAALAADRMPVTVPRSDQYSYVRTVQRDYGPGVPPGAPTTPVTYQVWNPQDVRRNAYAKPSGQSGYVIDTSGFGGVQGVDLVTYARLAALPTDDPSALLRAIVAESKSTRDPSAANVFATIVDSGFFAQVMPPSVRAATYRALATLPGITEERGLTDLAGRPAVGISAANHTLGMRYEVLFDPATHATLGVRTEPTALASGAATQPGRYSTDEAILQIAVVDKVGVPPGH